MRVLLAPTLPQAACRNTVATRALCEGCHDRPECLIWGLEHNEPGLWGGHNVAERRELRRRFGIELSSGGA